MRIDGDGRFAEGDVQHDIGGFSPDAGKLFKRLPIARNFAAMAFDQNFRQVEDIPGLGVEQPDRLDPVANPVLSQRLTPASVACADRTTATSSVNGLSCASSVCGAGFRASRRAKISLTVAGFMMSRGWAGAAGGFAERV
jgi:hypothetical protein